ncbi:MAG: adenylate/guanylate cyclase domain-containing protein [Candidatus Binatia bacterium]
MTTRSALEGERRQVTVLFADMEGFTALAEQLDPEEVHQIINRCFELITTEVHGFEGTINQYTGDGVMALFGAPIAHEDGPRRAIHAALAIQQALRHYSEELRNARGFGVQMRIGLNTGTVVVGKIGDDLRMDYTAVGDTTNLAARLEQAAVPGSVLISAATQKLVAGFFETRDLGTLQVKGHIAPLRAFEVLRARGRRARLDVAAERGLTPLVGRDRELATLSDLFQQVKGGHGQVVFIAGDAGIGKSRLVLELRRQMAGRVLGTTEFPAELHAALMEKAEGVPLFIEEVTKTLLDLGVLRRTNGSYRMVKGIEEVNVPETIHGIIMARLDRLGENGKRTVQLASVIGRQFLQRLLERVAGLPGQPRTAADRWVWKASRKHARRRRSAAAFQRDRQPAGPCQSAGVSWGSVAVARGLAACKATSSPLRATSRRLPRHSGKRWSWRSTCASRTKCGWARPRAHDSCRGSAKTTKLLYTGRKRPPPWMVSRRT